MSLMCNISNISRGSLHDGDGIRTVVYFKGCPLRCRWCHNPEALASEKVIMYSSVKCIACGECIKICPECHKAGDTKMIFERDKCIHCGKCAEVCPTGALYVSGETKSIDELFEIIKKDFHYYIQSGGGVTLSGGECLLQADFSAAFLEKCQLAGIHTAIETSLYVQFENIEKVLPYVDLIFADLKHHDPEKHKKYTGCSNELILENINRISHMHDNITIRIPLIPGVNDSEQDMCEFGKIIDSFGGGVKTVELLRYNYLAESKYEAVGMSYNLFGKQAQSDEKICKLMEVLNSTVRAKVTYN